MVSKNNKGKLHVIYNYAIKADVVSVIDIDEQFIGDMTTKEALKLAKARDMDLVEIANNNGKVVCKIIEIGKYLYIKKKAKSEINKKQKKAIVFKHIKVRLSIDQHDLMIKIRNIKEFLAEGDRVKITVMYRYREVVNNADAPKILCDNIINSLEGSAFNITSPMSSDHRKAEFVIQGSRKEVCSKHETDLGKKLENEKPSTQDQSTQEE